jgi:hypothetical protein
VEGSVRILGRAASNDPGHEYLRLARRAEPLGAALACRRLRVSLRKLEQLDDGRIDWIEDKHVYDVGAQGRPAPWQENDPAYWVPKEVKTEDRGTPLIGRIRDGGKAEPDEDWQEEWGRHIPQRFGKGHDIYGLELKAPASRSCYGTFPVWEFREGMAAVYCWNGLGSGRSGWFRAVVGRWPEP